MTAKRKTYPVGQNPPFRNQLRNTLKCSFMHGRSVLIDLQHIPSKLTELRNPLPCGGAIIHKKIRDTIGTRHSMASSAESLVFPEVSPYASSMIEAGGGHFLYLEQCGNPSGTPVIVLHGGPGSGCTPAQRRFFDPAHYRVILFDQRGCGRSQPAGLIEENTTQLLVEDIELIRRHLGIDRWLVFGGSWGSTLALAYASSHPQPVTGLILRGIFLTRPQEIAWFLYGVRAFFPEPWDRLVAPLSDDERKDILGAYQRRIFGSDRQASIAAARNWNAFEGSIISLFPPQASTSPAPSDETTLARARVQLHYLANGCFLAETPLLGRINKIRHIPAIIIQGRYDMVCPLQSAHELHLAWPEAQYQIIPDAGHGAFEPGIARALVAATERFKSLA